MAENAANVVAGGSSLFGGITGAQWLSAGSQVLGAALSDPGGASSSASSFATFDHSNYTVATGGAKANGGAGLQLPWYAWALLAYVGVVWLQQ